ncbi:HET-domain-containing protein [Ophiobolus disseminans]|uniref:HET-domain-containing protein n=1 Tax=Ophiobolus disseminans TaxID=1469910 RepID=A0A6A7A1G3_9PLEO|nr:HET-domain-containing protein [Ophiobolus disseminans]
MSYSYAKLPDDNSIRLLQLLPGCDDSILRCQLVVSQLDSNCCYEALSYVWGEADLSEALSIDDCQLNISKSLHSTITRLRRTHKTRTLWIDAICINQQDDQERGSQVALMGQIYHRADTVLCWLSETSGSRRVAMTYLLDLGNRANEYIKPDAMVNLWAITWDDLVPGADVDSVIRSAIEAKVEVIYRDPWFTRLWIVQEVALARKPVVHCSGVEIHWKELELATRVIGRCIQGISPQPEALRSIKDARDIMITRAQYGLNKRSIQDKPLHVQLDRQWSLGHVAWNSRSKKCKDDRDRVYAMLSLVSAGNNLGMYVPEPFAPDYTRSAEWAYGEFWARYGGYSSLFYAGLTRRCNAKQPHEGIQHEQLSFHDDYLQSWCPDLRPDAEYWKPIFKSDYAASTPLQHVASNLRRGANIGPMMIRGHRLDSIQLSFHIFRAMEPCQRVEDLMDFRDIMKLLLATSANYGLYPTGQACIEALGYALMTAMPSGPNESDHPFQRYLSLWNMDAPLNNPTLKKIWQTYLKELISDTGAIWVKFKSSFQMQHAAQNNIKQQSGFRFDPFKELSRECQLAWLLHKYIGDVLQKHRFIFTSRGYMGLAPPDARLVDVVAVLGGPGTAFVIRDLPGTAAAMQTPDTNSAHQRSESMSELLGPCYLHGVMDGELYELDRWKTELEWETCGGLSIPAPTICLV